MSFAILRTAKLKDWGNISASLQHTFRERVTPNSDQNRMELNQYIGGNSADEIRQKIENALPEKYRSDCVKCIEYLITASPEWFSKNDKAEHQRYFDRSIEWLKERHDEENIKCISIHNDENTPHLVAYVIPLDERGKLNAKKWLGGRKLMNEMQSSFAERVADFGLKRGVEGSKATHQRVQRFYGNIREDQPKLQIEDITPQLLKKGLFHDTYENDQIVTDRINTKLQAILDHKTAQINDLRQKLGETQTELKKTRQKLAKMHFNEQMKQIQAKVQEKQKNRDIDDLGRSKGFDFGR